jgi:serine/threonine-protein kinase
VRSAGADVDQVDIFVDGQKRCDFSPCVLELPAGPARIRAAQGSASAHRSLQVTGGKEYAVRLDLPASAADQGQGQHGNMANLELYGASTGIEVFVDGQRKGTLPVVLLDLKPGKIQLLFKGGEEFRSLERTVELEAGKTLVVDDIRLPLRIVKVQFVVDEAVTSVELVRQGHPERVTRLEIGGDGRATQQLDTSHRWAVRAKGKGDLQLYLPISFTDGEPEKTINVVFPTEPDLEGDESAATDAANAPTAVDGETAFLNCNSIPPSQVIVDGRQLGTTPISGIEVAPGTHAVVFVSGEGRKARSVSVKPGETKAVVVRF